MKRLFYLFLLLTLTALKGMAQEITPAVTVYNEFQPATIITADGKKVKVPLANIFLKNSSLLYKSGVQTKEAYTNTLQRVEFKDRTYYRVDTVLAYRVDTVGADALFCSQRIDFDAYYRMRANNRTLTDLSIGDQVSYTTADLGDERDIHFPVVSVYYYLYHGKYVRCHERNLSRLLNKEQKRMMATMMNDKSFSWTDEQSLLKLLKLIQ